VTIGGDTYNALYDSAGTLVTAGNDFTLYVPNSNNSDGAAGATLVEDIQTQVVTYLEYNLMDLNLQTNGTQSGAFQNGLNGAPVNKTTERGEDISFYAVLPWSQVTIDSIRDASDTLIQVTDITTPTYYAAFTYQGTTYTASIVTDTSSGKKNIKFNALTSRGATTSVTMNRINIRAGLPGGGTKALP
jgi:hypothetical protein